jgi:3-hydroxyacyl-CoA dehydrogenase
MVIEAVYEDMGLKKKVFADLSRLAPRHAILASNTSYQNIDDMARETDRPDRVVGMHYFSPANVMKLLEIVRGEATSAETLATVIDLARKTGKVPVVVGVCYGFVGNRMLWQRTVQTQKLLLEGCSPREIDTVLTDFGFRMGPCQMQDLAGVDVAWRLRQARGERMEPVDTIADAGRWGQKTGKGYYLYPEGARAGVDDPDVMEMVAGVAKRLGVAQRKVGREEIHQRLLFPLINEGFRILAEGIVERASDIDVVYLHGYGWPRDKGGPMHYAESCGLKTVADALEAMADRTGDDDLRPAPLLRRMAESGDKLADFQIGRN